jgi:hypothetical protein
MYKSLEVIAELKTVQLQRLQKYSQSRMKFFSTTRCFTVNNFLIATALVFLFQQKTLAEGLEAQSMTLAADMLASPPKPGKPHFKSSTGQCGRTTKPQI